MTLVRLRIAGYGAVLHSRVCIAQAFEAGSRYPAGAISIRMETRYLPKLAPSHGLEYRFTSAIFLCLASDTCATRGVISRP
jgi:hypothetical protein